MSVELLGSKIDNYTFDECINKGIELIRSDNVSQVVTINPEMLMQAQKDENLAKIIDEAEMVIADGIGIKIALKLKGLNINRIPGIDFAHQLVKICAEQSVPIGIVGAKEEVLVKAVSALKAEFPNLNIVYSHNGYFDDNNDIYEELKQKKPGLILIALGSPKQEQFIYGAKMILSQCLMIGIGGSLDVWSGEVKRAPIIYQKLGLEWLYRTISQPERFKRIFPTLPIFLYRAITWSK